jgi:hypothetical protein
MGKLPFKPLPPTLPDKRGNRPKAKPQILPMDEDTAERDTIVGCFTAIVAAVIFFTVAAILIANIG